MGTAIVTVVLASLAAASPAPPAPAKFAWMSGDWIANSDGRWTEEHWSRPRADVMLGYSRSGRGSQSREFEFLRIAADTDGGVTYWGQPQGRAAVGFKLISSGPMNAVFENPAHDYPTRIAYSRNGTTMTVTISGLNGSNQQSWTYQRR